MKLPAAIYIDTAFITDFYEKANRVSVPVRVVKKSNISGGLSAGLFGTGFNTGATMEEEKEFPISGRKMYDQLVGKLKKIPSIELRETKDAELPELFWVNGIFAMAQSSISDKPIDHYTFQPDLRETKRVMFLVLNDTYFSTGYDQLSRYGYSLSAGFGIHARLLVRLLYLDQHYPVGAPMVIIKTANVEADE